MQPEQQPEDDPLRNATTLYVGNLYAYAFALGSRTLQPV